MALYPVHANERDATGLFRAHSDFAGGEGGLLVRVTSEGTNSPAAGTQNTPRVDYVNAGGTDYSTPLYGLLDEQLTRPETLLGSFLPSNATPVALGPATHLASGRVSIWQNTGYFMTDHFAIELDTTAGSGEGYGEPVNLVAGAALLATSADASDGTRRGTLCDAASATALSVATATTRCYFMSLVDDASDLLASRVSPAPTTGMFAQGPKILIYQA